MPRDLATRGPTANGPRHGDSFIASGDHEGATEKVYETAREVSRRNAYTKAQNYAHDGNYTAAANWFLALGDYEDSAEQAGKAQEA